MKVVLFFEKPGCTTNAKQKIILKEAGCLVLTRNLLDHKLNEEELFAYLKGRSIAEWFNPNAPALKQGILKPNSLNRQEALKLLIDDPILIRRPLLNIDGNRMCGFDQPLIEEILGTALQRNISEVCSASDTTCAAPISSASAQ